jgi:hypothetical protein
MKSNSWCTFAFVVYGFSLIALFANQTVTAQDLQNWRTIRQDEIFEMAKSLPSREALSSINVDQAVREMVEKLDDESFAVREQATQSLLSLEIDRSQIYAVLEFDSLTAEQRYRLLTVVREMLTRMPRGALGISMRQMQFAAAGPVEIRVEDLIEGLPAERVLRVGDGIIAFDGKPLMAQTDLQFRIQSKKPGERAVLTVKRVRVDDAGQHVLDANNQIQFDTIDVEIELGSAEMLRNSNLNNPGFERESILERQRAREAAEVAQNYSPKPREIVVKGSLTAMSLSAQSEPERFNDARSARRVDDHPLIRNLLEQRTMIAQGQRAITPAMRQQWAQTLNSLIELAKNDQLTLDERSFLAEVIERYVELTID